MSTVVKKEDAHRLKLPPYFGQVVKLHFVA